MNENDLSRDPKNVMQRAALWLRLFVEMTDVEPEDTTIKVNIAGEGPRAGENLATVTLAGDLKLLDELGGGPVAMATDFERVED